MNCLRVRLLGHMGAFSGHIGPTLFKDGVAWIEFGDGVQERAKAEAHVARVRANYNCSASEEDLKKGGWSAWVGMEPSEVEGPVTPENFREVFDPHSRVVVSVVVTVHPPYVKYLGECLESIRTQAAEDSPLSELWVVYDAPELDEALLDVLDAADDEGEYLQNRVLCCEFKNSAEAKNEGAKLCSGRFLLYVDADDVLVEGFVESSVNALLKDDLADAAYPSIEYFGDLEQVRHLQLYSWEQLQERNYMVNSSMVRRDAFERVGGFDPEIGGYWDWDLWLRLLRPDGGRRATRANTRLRVRVHSANRDARKEGGGWGAEVRARNLSKAIFIAYCGREYCRDAVQRVIDRPGWPKEELALYVYDTSPEPDRQRFEIGGEWGKVVYHHDPVSLRDTIPDAVLDGDPSSTEVAAFQGRARALLAPYIAKKTADIYNWMLHHVVEDLCYIMEDDTEPAPDVLGKLLEGIDTSPNVGSVTGWYLERTSKQVIIREGDSRTPMTPKGSDVIEECHSSGLGACLLCLSSLRLRGIRFRHKEQSGGKGLTGSDHALFHQMRETGLTRRVHWGVPCKHWTGLGKYLDAGPVEVEAVVLQEEPAVKEQERRSQPATISVLMCAYNAESYVQEALDSIFAQTMQDFELVVIDDGSTDRTGEIVLATGDPRLRYHKLDRNVGLPKALNIGLKLCTGEYIVRQDADDYSEPTRIEKQVELLDSNPNMAVAGAWFNVLDMENGETVRKFIKEIQTRDGDPRRFGGLALGGSTMRASALLSVGGHDPNFPAAQDFRLYLDLNRAGWDIGAVQEILYTWRINHPNHASGEGKDRRKQVARASSYYQRALRTATIPRVGILLMGFNRLSMTKRAVEALDEHAREPYDLYLLDNGSRDGTAEFFAEMGTRDNVYVTTLEENIGCPAGRAYMMQRIDNELVMWLDNDMIVDAGWLTRLVEAMDDDSSVGAAFMSWRDKGGQRGAVRVVQCSGDHIAYRWDPPDPSKHAMESAYFPGGASLLRRSAFWTSQDWAEMHVRVAEEIPLSLGLQEQGYKVVSVPKSTATHVGKEMVDAQTYHAYRESCVRDGTMVRDTADKVKARFGVNPIRTVGWPKSGVRILLIFPPPPDRTDIPVSLPPALFPQGLGFVQAMLTRARHRVRMIDYRVEQPDLKEAIDDFDPDWVGVYTTTIGWVATKQFLARVRECTNSPIVIGGPHATLFPETAPDVVDHVVQGEGESIMKSLIEGKTHDKVLRLSHRENLVKVPWPDFTAMRDKPYCREEKRFGLFNMASLNDTRGCPHACKFCSARRILKGGWTAFSAPRVLEAASDLKSLGFGSIYFRADNWTHDVQRVRDIADGLRDLGMPFACETRVDALTPDDLAYLADRGLRGVYLGVESGSQRVLDAMVKGITVEQTKSFILACKPLGIKTYAACMWYYPGETDEDRQATEDMLKEVQPDDVGRSVFIGMPGSRSAEELTKTGEYEHIDESGIVYPEGYAAHTKEVYGRVRVPYDWQSILSLRGARP